ncbi:hypothetical protein predicted by Glimmer/Critica [Bdellovibrio bacteriovorus HD100]|uniref:Uncharacterized protein n=1 Tax=Bdellovibrio bacteriovorus (strain ATCC 15356 / DSM 50701 / NCIMB 9529 / HD100) TaxID=264462 RepID=Q6MQF4_BDEBA|nr:hypothetical protein predicted by Glimmer/Critica [Bdellovibrio bacteriovorus HD100]
MILIFGSSSGGSRFALSEISDFDYIGFKASRKSLHPQKRISFRDAI